MHESHPPGDGPTPFRPVVVQGSFRRAGRGPRTPRRAASNARRWLTGGALLAVVIVLAMARAVSRRLADWLWYREIGFERVFLTKIAAQWALGLTVGVISFVVLYANARWALRGLDPDRDPEPLSMMERLRAGPRSRDEFLGLLARILSLPGTALMAFLLALGAAAQWRAVLLFLHRTPFGTTDPVFGRDVGYYVFSLPVAELVLGIASLLVLLSLFFVALPVYVARGEVFRRGPAWRLEVQPTPRTHLAVLTALFFVLAALRIHLVEVPSLLLAPHVSLFGASYTDLNARLPALRVLSVVALLGAAAVLWGAWRGRFVRNTAITLGGYLVLAFLITGVVPALYQRLLVQANELARETPQIAHHIAATRRAWGLEGVERRELGGESQLTLREIEANSATIRNVRLWDREPLLQTFGQIQSIRTYYDFVAVDDDRYRIGGELRQVLLSARELNSAALPTRTFINEHLTYTHGMGITLGPSNQVTGEGLPVLFVKDLPPASSVREIRVTRPQIYFGELSNEFILVPTRQREFDYPAGEGEAAVYSSYDGRAGVPVGSFGRRLLYALRFGSLNILLSRDITDRSRILYHRDVIERALRALPFLDFDRDPYLVVTDAGRLNWILDGYTITDRYPYAQPAADGVNYMRNSAKVVIDAYDGDVRAYLADPADPIIRTFAAIYPGLLRPMAELPADLRAHLRYPADLFNAQTALFATYHMSDPETFYHREDQWQIPGLGRNQQSGAFIRHIVMRLPGEREPEFILMRPFTPRQKDNLAAWMVARNDGPHYGKLVVYRFPRQSLVFGPTQIVNRINQDTDVARQISLWDQRGSEVIRGELLVIPIEESLIYVQPLYLRAQGGRIPELKRVVVAHEGRVAMEETLEAGLARLFGGAGGQPSEQPAEPLEMAAARRPAAAPGATGAPAAAADTATLRVLARRAAEHYEAARAAQRADDWARYGAEMRRLGELLRQLGGERPRE